MRNENVCEILVSLVTGWRKLFAISWSSLFLPPNFAQTHHSHASCAPSPVFPSSFPFAYLIYLRESLGILFFSSLSLPLSWLRKFVLPRDALLYRRCVRYHAAILNLLCREMRASVLGFRVWMLNRNYSSNILYNSPLYRVAKVAPYLSMVFIRRLRIRFDPSKLLKRVIEIAIFHRAIIKIACFVQ